MILSPFDENISFAACNISEAKECDLHPQELEIITQFKNKARRSQYIAGRIAAQKAFLQIENCHKGPILRSADGLPLWPCGFIGSIAHNDAVAIACVASQVNYQSLGIDVESINRSLEKSIEKRVLTEKEKDWAQASQAESKFRLLCIFSAKEAIYKALYPICKIIFGFKDVELDWDENLNAFKATLLEPLSEGLSRGSIFNVRVKVSDNLISTGLVVLW